MINCEQEKWCDTCSKRRVCRYEVKRMELMDRLKEACNVTDMNQVEIFSVSMTCKEYKKSEPVSRHDIFRQGGELKCR